MIRKKAETEALEVIRQDGGLLKIDAWTLGINGLASIVGEPSIESCQRFGQSVSLVSEYAQFNVGDFILWVEEHHGEQASQAIDWDTFGTDAVQDWRWVAERVPPSIRRMHLGLRFSHHRAVAKLEPIEQDVWLQKAVDQKWKYRELKAAMRQAGVGKGKSGQAYRPFVWWLMVRCNDEADYQALFERLVKEGRQCKIK